MNLRPSGYEPDELPGCSTPRQEKNPDAEHPGILFAKLVTAFTALAGTPDRAKNAFHAAGRPGDDLLSRALRQSTIGATGFHGRVRNGIGWDTCAITTWSSRHMYLCTLTGRRAIAAPYPSKAKLRRHPKLECMLAKRGALALAFTHD